MNPKELEAQFYEIQNKIFQALRIYQKLEERREFCIRQLRATNDKNEILNYLRLLVQIYEMEKRLLEICEKGLENAQKILDEAEYLIVSSETFFSRIKSNIKSKLPFFRKETDKLESITIMLRLMFSELKKEVLFIIENLFSIRDIINIQYKKTLEIISEVEQEHVIGNISESKIFREIQDWHDEEYFIIKRIKEKSKRYKLLERLKNLNQAISSHPILAKTQAAILSVPSETAMTTVGIYFLGWEFYPLIFIMQKVIKYSPTIAIFTREQLRI